MNHAFSPCVACGVAVLALAGCSRPSSPVLSRVPAAGTPIVWGNWIYPGAVEKASASGTEIEVTQAAARTSLGGTTAKLFETPDPFAQVWTFYARKAGYDVRTGRETAWFSSNQRLSADRSGIAARLAGSTILNADGRGVQSSIFSFDTDSTMVAVTVTRSSAQPTTGVAVVVGYR